MADATASKPAGSAITPDQIDKLAEKLVEVGVDEVIRMFIHATFPMDRVAKRLFEKSVSILYDMEGADAVLKRLLECDKAVRMMQLELTQPGGPTDQVH